MSGAFTPGPWKFGHLGTEAFWVGPDYDQKPVAKVDHDTELARDNSRANAALMASAPDLYLALSNLIENPIFQTAVGGNPNAVDEMLDHARTSLAKARGISPEMGIDAQLLKRAEAASKVIEGMIPAHKHSEAP